MVGVCAFLQQLNFLLSRGFIVVLIGTLWLVYMDCVNEKLLFCLRGCNHDSILDLEPR